MVKRDNDQICHFINFYDITATYIETYVKIFLFLTFHETVQLKNEQIAINVTSIDWFCFEYVSAGWTCGDIMRGE
jgi:hypothetical protein